jgi:hypothetical protein
LARQQLVKKKDISQAREFLTELRAIYETQAVQFEDAARLEKSFEERTKLNGFASASRVQGERITHVLAVLSELSRSRRARGPR